MLKVPLFAYFVTLLISCQLERHGDMQGFQNDGRPDKSKGGNKVQLVGKVRIKADVVDSDLLPRQPVYVDLSFTNHLTSEISLDLGGNYLEAISLEVKFPSGLVKRFPQKRIEDLALLGILRIPGGDAVTKRILLSEWFTPDEKGVYLVEGKVRCIATMSDKTTIRVDEPFALTLTVAAESAEGIKKVAQKLLEEAKRVDNAAIALDAARALSLIKSELANPYIVEALIQNPMVGHQIVNTLRERGDRESTKALITVSGKPISDEIAGAARSALAWITEFGEHDDARSAARQFLGKSRIY